MEFGDGPELDWACSNCPKKRPEDLHPYTIKLLTLRTLKTAGYPMQANDLLYQEWLDLGRLCLQLDAAGAGPLMGRGKSERGAGNAEEGKGE